jgi:hypothetical protein
MGIPVRIEDRNCVSFLQKFSPIVIDLFANPATPGVLAAIPWLKPSGKIRPLTLPPSKGDRFDAEDLAHLPCRVVIRHHEYPFIGGTREAQVETMAQAGRERRASGRTVKG